VRVDYQQPHTKAWSAKIAVDAFVFVTPEYNHGVCAPLKNALDTLIGVEQQGGRFCLPMEPAVGFVRWSTCGSTAAELQMARCNGR